MKLKNSLFLRNVTESLNRLLNLEDMPTKECYNIVKLIKNVDEKMKLFNDTKNAIIKKYSGGKDAVDPSKLDENKRKSFFKELDELIDIEFEIDIANKIRIKKDAHGLRAIDIMALEDVIEVED